MGDLENKKHRRKTKMRVAPMLLAMWQKMPYPYTTSAQIVQYPWRYVTEWKPGNHFMRMYIRTMIAFLPIWHFLEVGLSADHIDMVKMRYKKPFQRALEHYHAEEEIRQAALERNANHSSSQSSLYCFDVKTKQDKKFRYWKLFV